MKTALRTKILVGVALAITGYVGLSSNDPQTVETARKEDSTPRVHSQPAREKSRTGAARALVSLAQRVAGGESVQALFAAHSWYVPPPPPPPAPPAPVLSAEQLAALQRPVAPPLPFTFIGSYVTDGGIPVFFLTHGDRVYNVRVGDMVDDTYKVDSFTNGQLLMTYKPLNVQQQLSVGGSQR
jgi:hypothetical protein